MRKFILGTVSAVLVLALAGVALATSAFKQTASVGFTGHRAGASTGIDSKFTSSDALSAGSKPKQATKIVISFPAGTRFNLGTGAVGACDLTDKQIRHTEFGPFCPKSSQVGSGTATLNTMPMGTGPVSAKVTVFRHTGRALYIVVFPSLKQIPSWQPWVLHATASGRRLTIAIPAQIYGKGVGLPHGISAALTMLKFTTTAVGSGSDALVRAGKCTSGRFKVSSRFIYANHSRLTLRSSSRCSG